MMALLADFGLSTMTVPAIENLVQAGAAAEDDTDEIIRPFSHSRRRVRYQRFDQSNDAMVWLIA